MGLSELFMKTMVRPTLNRTEVEVDHPEIATATL